ncbi:MAG: flagellar filament capping protein FliD [Deltaproteobacteria bacterium]|nr:flagellar filament capping protein FliD [Deltaproteobacteria bacterium]
MAGGPIDALSTLSPELQKAYQVASAFERRPLQAITNKKEKIQERVNLLDDIIGKVESSKKTLPPLGSTIAIREFLVASSDEKVVTGTADKAVAVPGAHHLDVLQLATGASALSNRFEDRDQTRIGTGYLTFTTVAGETKEVFVDDDNATLDGLAKVINSAQLGVRASVVRDNSDLDAPFRMLLVHDGTGTDKDVEYPVFYFVDGEEEFYLDEFRDATNARLKYEGMEIESPSNDIDDLISGVTLNLKGLTDPGKPTVVKIEQDIPKTTLKVKELVEKLNQVFAFVQDQNKFDDKTQSLKTLGGDYGMNLTEMRLRTALQQNFLGEPGRKIRSLNDIGIQFNRNGTLEFNDKKFAHSLNENFDEVVDILAGDGISYGVITKLSSALNSISGSNTGLLSTQRQNYAGQIYKLNKDLEAKEKHVQRKDEMLKEKLARSQAAITALQGQASFFASQSSNQGFPAALLGG